MQTLIRLLVVLAMIVRGVIPVGFMPAQDRNGGIELVICTGHGMLVLPDSTPALPSHKSDDRDSVCPFAASAPIAIASVFADAPIVTWTRVGGPSLPAYEHFTAYSYGTALARAPPSRQV
jgi:hypothetical protein